LTQDEIKALLSECEKQVTSPWLLPLVTLALNTGMRQGELLKLNGKTWTWSARIDNHHPG
jgi:integrase